MTAFEAVLNELLSRPCDDAIELPTSPSRDVSRLPSGSFRLDYGDADHIFIFTLQQMTCRQLGPVRPQLIGHIDELEAYLTAVIVDTHVHVDLDIPESPRRTELFQEYQLSFDSWAATVPTEVNPPAQPGERLWKVTISIADDVGTTYALRSGRAGGTGTDWQARRSFLPVPPDAAQQLTVTLHTPDGNTTIAEFAI